MFSIKFSKTRVLEIKICSKYNKFSCNLHMTDSHVKIRWIVYTCIFIVLHNTIPLYFTFSWRNFRVSSDVGTRFSIRPVRGVRDQNLEWGSRVYMYGSPTLHTNMLSGTFVLCLTSFAHIAYIIRLINMQTIILRVWHILNLFENWKYVKTILMPQILHKILPKSLK